MKRYTTALAALVNLQVFACSDAPERNYDRYESLCVTTQDCGFRLYRTIEGCGETMRNAISEENDPEACLACLETLTCSGWHADLSESKPCPECQFPSKE